MAKSDDSFEDILSSNEKISDDGSNSPQTRRSGRANPHTTHDLSRSMFHVLYDTRTDGPQQKSP
jgi:hypothetical protein